MGKKVYIGKKADGTLVAHTDMQAMKELDGVGKAIKEFPIEEFEAAGGFVREVNGKIVLGKTETELQEEQNQQRIVEIDHELADINMKQTRSSAEIADALAHGTTPQTESITFHRQREQRAATLRAERVQLAS